MTLSQRSLFLLAHQRLFKACKNLLHADYRLSVSGTEGTTTTANGSASLAALRTMAAMTSYSEQRELYRAALLHVFELNHDVPTKLDRRRERSLKRRFYSNLRRRINATSR